MTFDPYDSTRTFDKMLQCATSTALSQAIDQIELMKCCGNCANYVPVIGQDKCCKGLTSTHEWEPITGFSKCDKWEMR